MMDYHEPPDSLSPEVRDQTRALTSLKEEIEAVDWYTQRAACCQDDELRAILIHNRDEEIEHACMTIEWLRRRVPAWNRQLETYLFTKTPIVGSERAARAAPDAQQAPSPARASDGSLGIGSLQKERA
jgi:ferritin-like protein